MILLRVWPIIWMGLLAYYLAECVRDSASGNTRAADTINSPPGLWDALKQIGLVLVVIGPASLYGVLRSANDRTIKVYPGLVLVLGAGLVLVLQTASMLSRYRLGILAPPMVIYVLMILAHLLGRFYFRYSKKIGWDI